MGKNTEQSRDRLALLLGLILILAAIGLVVTVVLVLKKVGTVELVKELSIQWSSIKLGLVVAAVLLAPAAERTGRVKVDTKGSSLHCTFKG